MSDPLKAIRWKQRHQNFSRAVALLEEAARLGTWSRLEKEGLIQRFEYTFELGWKTLKDFLEAKGLVEKFPRDVIKAAFAAEILADGEVWIDMLERRNLLSHTYDEALFDQAFHDASTRFTRALGELKLWLDTQL